MNAINLSPAQAEALAHVPTGHEPNAGGTAQAIAQALDITTAQAAARLGALRKAGLVERDAQGDATGAATWARFDSIAPGLEAAQVDALRKAEAARPCRYQAEALEAFGPLGVSWRSDLKAETRDALEARTPAAIVEHVAPALEANRPQRAANLYREAARHCAGQGRRARYEERARTLEAEAEAQARKANAQAVAQAVGPCRPNDKAAQALEALKAAQAVAKDEPNARNLEAQTLALGDALEALDARPQVLGLMVRPRPYLCRVCGALEDFSTNHTGAHYSPCAACSWRGGRDDSGRWYSAQDKGRPHVYAGDNPQGTGETNPHARKAEAPALPAPGVTLDNGAVALEARAVDGRAFVLALIGDGRACPFVVWRLGPSAMGKAWPCYSGDYCRTLGDALEALEKRAARTVAA